MSYEIPVEVMAPVGSYESLAAALQAGADSVYLGVTQLNMRARSSDNFSIHDLEKINSICKEKDVKTYLTLNTILYDHDMSLMKKIVDAAAAAGVDAVIASDQAAISYAYTRQLPVHISTQLNITNTETLKFYAPFADVVVLSRELNLSQVHKIIETIYRENITGPLGNPVRIELFAHGALCMAISGKCYLSLHTHNASANRGACKQNCRRPYTVEDEEGNTLSIDNEYIMSPKDLCTIDFLDKVLDAGVSVLKIEGRGRSADYVYETVSCYKEAAEAIRQGVYSPAMVKGWVERLKGVYNRGFWDGYYLGRKLGEWADSGGSKATVQKVYAGKGVKYYPKTQVAEFIMESGEISTGEEVLIAGPTTGILKTPIREIWIDGTVADKATRGQTFTTKLEAVIRQSDKLYKLVNRASS